VPQRIAIIGTGTGIGKTHAAVALIAALTRRGHQVSGLKPIETGVGYGESDADALARVSTIKPHPQPYTFPSPVSPHLEARRTGTTISLDTIDAWVASHTADYLIIETAGGLLSPLGPTLTNLDLVRRLAPDFIYLIAVDRLGVLHDVRACTLLLKLLAPELPPPACILQHPRVSDHSTGTNADELLTLGIVSRVSWFPYASPTTDYILDQADHALAVLVSRETPRPPT
jgi:dethiobiotin synthetase